MFWYVLFVKTGYEDKVVNEINKTWKGKVGELRPFVPKRDSKFRKADKVILEKCRLFLGYIFIETEIAEAKFAASTYSLITHSEHALKLLRYGQSNTRFTFEMKEEEWQAFLRLYNDHDCVDMSQGFIVGGRITITNGPMLGFESHIKENKQAQDGGDNRDGNYGR
ncbi:MAG: hypothetical protein LBR98_10175 [Syntrophomonadaceae bacterium]|nr:hypothetical protein [Syntrophomonadaceae bacterium]